MQRITKLKIDAFKEQFAYTYPKKWGEIKSKANTAGRSFSLATISQMEEFIAEELDRALSEAISAEKQALLSIPSIHEDAYFETLTNKLLDAVGGIVNSVVNHVKNAARSYVLAGRGTISPILFDKVKGTLSSKIVR